MLELLLEVVLLIAVLILSLVSEDYPKNFCCTCFFLDISLSTFLSMLNEAASILLLQSTLSTAIDSAGCLVLVSGNL